MFDFLIPLAWAFVIYVVVVMLLNRRERRTIIGLLGDKVTPEMLNRQQPLPWFGTPSISPDATRRSRGYGALRAACLFIGVGLGLIVALFLNMSIAANSVIFERLNGLWQVGGISIIYVAGMLLCGGLGLLVAFIIENHSKKREE